MVERPRILVIDDSEMNRNVTARQLGKLGFDTDLAASGGAALDLLCQRSYAMILVDRRMPGMDGFEFAALLREREVGARDRTPVVMMTADEPRQQDAARLASEFDGLLVKPVTLAQLNAILPGRAPALEPPPGPSEGVGGGDGAPIDAAALARLMGDAAPATLARVIGQFCRAFDDLQPRLDAAAAAQDRAALAALAHTAKGTASTAAATAIAARMKELEALAPTGDWGAIADCLADARAGLDRVRRLAATMTAGAGAPETET
jgi:CheY-like chemotaxis protein